MQRENEDEAWRAIVENYGDRADLDPDPPVGSGTSATTADPDTDPWGEDWGEDWPQIAAAPVPEPANDLQRADDERFVPPAPPPLPRPSRDRLVAWVGIFGSPTILLIALVAQIHLPTWLGYLLVAGFVGGFLYLVLQMPRGPRDPFDDGARL